MECARFTVVRQRFSWVKTKLQLAQRWFRFRVLGTVLLRRAGRRLLSGVRNGLVEPVIPVAVKPMGLPEQNVRYPG